MLFHHDIGGEQTAALAQKIYCEALEKLRKSYPIVPVSALLLDEDSPDLSRGIHEENKKAQHQM
eukprot:6472051-Amphidinium_carterae.3